MHSKLIFGKEAREKILEGARKAAEAVICTLGPAGRNAMIRRPPQVRDGKTFYFPPLVTKDGVTVADNIQSFADPWEDMGLQIVKDAARNTNKTGDGTTTASLLTYEMMKGGAELLNAGANAIHVKRGMDKACAMVCEQLTKIAKKVESTEELAAIATISSQDAEIGQVIANAVKEVGTQGAITMQMGLQSKTHYEIVSGMQIPVGFASHYFAKNGNATIRDPFIIVTTEKIASIRDLSPILTAIRMQLDAQEGSKGAPLRLVIFSTGVTGDALSTLATNNVDSPNELQCLVLNPPHFGERQKEVLEDIAICTGAKLIDRTAGRTVQEMRIPDLGTCGSVLASASMTTIVEAHGHTEKLEARVKQLQEKLEKEEDAGNKDYLKSRIAGLNGKIANVYVGGASQMEQREKLHRVEDAIAAAKAAHETGILPGGGVAYLRCMRYIHGFEENDEGNGAKIVQDALEKQLYWVTKNAGEDADRIIAKVLGMEDSEGFNAETREYGDMYAMKVIDPAKVPISALKNAVSAAGMFLTAEVGINNEEEKKQ